MPPSEPGPPPDPGALLARIRDEIRAAGPISFARFMELALHDPHGGYYARDPVPIGPRGDFVTASDVGSHFGRCIARQLVELDRCIGPLAPFDVVEHGGGRGLLARDILDAMTEIEPALALRLRYVIVDASEAMRRESRRRVPEAEVLAPAELPATPARRGCVLAVELFDALPVHRLRRRAGRLLEVRIGVDGAGQLIEHETEPAAPLAARAARYGAAAEEGSEAEVSLADGEQLTSMAAGLERGLILIIDYGDRADRLHAGRPTGTLLAYRGHRAHTAYLAHVGQQDLTAHVNFSALEDHARTLGLAPLGLTTQDRFLLANGLAEAFAAPSAAAARSPQAVKRRLQALQLIHPAAMGRAFRVLALGKQIGRPILAGLRDPFAG